MSLITIRTSCHRNSCLDNTTEADTAAYDESIGRFIDFLKSRAATDGHSIEINDQPNQFGSSTVTDAEGNEWLSTQPMFWDWYQQHA